MSKVLAVILAVCVVVCAAVGIGVYVYTNDETTEPQIPSDPPTELPTEEPITPPEEPPTEIPTEPPIEIPEGDFTVTFMMNCIDGGVYLTEYVDDGETVVEPEVPEKPKENYLFVKWTTDKENRYAYDFLTPVTADLVLYADWDVMGTSSGSGHSHNWEETSVTEATCVADGERTFTCSCGQTKTETIPATGEHSYTENVKQPTCVEEGEAFCICGDKQTTPPTGHSVVENKEDGTFAPKCSVCDEEYQAMLSTQGNVKTYHTKVAYAFANASAEDGLHTIHLAADMDSRIALDKAVIISSHNHKVNLSCTIEDHIKILKDGCTFEVIGDTSVATNVDVTLQSGEKIYLISDDDNEYLEPIQPDEWDGTADTSWYNDSDTEFTLTSAEQIAGLAILVDEGNTFAGKTIKLATDMDLGAHDENGKPICFDPIGSCRNDKAFKGTFDGQGHTISNLNQNTWALNNGYYYGDLGLGLFGLVEDATIKDLNIDGAGISGESAMCGVVAASSSGTTTYENIKVSNSNCADYLYSAGGIVGCASGNQKFINCDVTESTTIGGQWGDFGNANGGVIGEISSDSTIYMKDCEIACRIDAVNDVVSAYQWYCYRNSGMLIGTTNQQVADDNNDGVTNAAAPQLTCENVKVIYGDWANYHYCKFAGTGFPYVRVEAGTSVDAYSNVRYGHPKDANGNTVVDDNHVHNDGEDHMQVIAFDQLYGGNAEHRYCIYGVATHDGVTVVYNNK